MSIITCTCLAYHSLARAISVLGDAESAVNILQVCMHLTNHGAYGAACTLTALSCTAGDEDAAV